MDKNRIERLRYKMEKRKASICSQRAILYTESFKESEEDSYILRKAKAFKHTLENMSIYIENDSLIFGNQASRNFAAPIFPEFSIQWVIDELDEFEKREKIKELILNSKNILIKILDISYGGTNSAIIDIKSILSEPIKMGAPKIILVHNHPSGDPTPSKEDIDTTIKVKEAAEMFGIELLDHIVMGDGKYKSIYTYVNNTRIH